jgi:DNA ligase-1
MTIKSILDEISADGGKIYKINTLTKYKDNDLLKDVIYLAHSPRINFYIKQIPEYIPLTNGDDMPLENALESLRLISERKVTGGEAKEVLTNVLTSVSAEDAYVIERIIDKNLKIGMDSGINKVIPNLIEETPYQGAKSFSEKGAKNLFKKKGEIVISQVKADGTYRNAIIQDGIVEMVSRQGEVSYLKGTKFLDELKGFPNCVLNGELTIDGFKRTEANGMVSSMMDIIEKAEERGEKTTANKKASFEEKHGRFDEALSKMRFTVWDMISNDEYANAKSDTPYTERLDDISDLINGLDTTMVSLVETRYITTFEQAMEHFLDTQERGLEGTIIKSSTSGWKDGKPTYQIKMKLEMSMDLRIVGFEYGNVGTKNEHVISTLNVESSCGKLRTNPSGMKEDMMADITNRQDELLGTIVEIRCCGLSQDSKGNWSTAHPSVVELRTDKNTCDSLETCIEIEDMAKKLKTI